MNQDFKEVNVLQHLDYEVHPIDLKLTDTVLISTGIYKPSIKIHTLSELSLKNERCIEDQAIKLEPITDDGLKLAILREDRYVELHAKYGFHNSIRIPSNGIDLQFNKVIGELLLLGKKGLYRFNLCQGRFMKEISSNKDNGLLYSMRLSLTNGLIAVGNENNIELYDSRSRKVVTVLERNDPVATIDFHLNGNEMVCGDINGEVFLYDLRESKKVSKIFTSKSQNEITKIKFNNDFICASERNRLLIFDGKNQNTTNDFERNKVSEIELGEITSFDCKGGLFFISCESDNKIKSFYNNKLGEAPIWCKFVENSFDEIQE